MVPKPKSTEVIRVEFTLNGEPVAADVRSDRSLLHFLREDLGLIGSKDGCSEGSCGACTVVQDGKATKACLLTMNRVAGSSITSIEGLDAGDGIHPLRLAFMEAGALQCGFCTPGQVMAAKALLDWNPDPSVDEIKEHMKGNLCRCHEYQRIVTAIQRAGEIARTGEVELAPILKADEKSGGELLFADDIRLPGMLQVAARRADHPHAEILAIDTTPAAGMPGVVRVLTAKDIPGENIFGLIQQDQPVLCHDKVRYLGDPIALVVAETRDQARAAAAAIQVEYRVLPPVGDAPAGLKPDAPQIHQGGNVLIHTLLQRGDVAAAFTECDVIIEDTYETPMVEQGYIEPEAGVAYLDEDGRYVVMCGGQNPHSYQRQIAKSLGVPLERVRVIYLPTGGSFGGKHDINVQIHLALAVHYTRRPCQMAWTRYESLITHPKRHPVLMHYKTGCTSDGLLKACQVTCILDKGAYASEGTAVVEACTVFAPGPYRYEAVYVEGQGVYTNNTPCGAFRGFGVPQVCVGHEAQIDRLAAAVGMDPIAFREKNILRTGDLTPSGQLLTDEVAAAECLARAKQALAAVDLPEPGPDEAIGVGLACSIKNAGMGLGVPEPVGGIIGLQPDGRFLIRTGAVDMGQGTDSGMVLMAAEMLGLPPACFDLLTGDTDLTPDCGPTVASRQLMVSGYAVVKAAQEMARRLPAVVSELTGVQAEEILLRADGCYERSSGRRLVTLPELHRRLARHGVDLVCESRHAPPMTDAISLHPDFAARHGGGHASGELAAVAGTGGTYHHFSYTWGCQAAIVRVHLPTGKVRVERIIAVHDVGRVIHRSRLEGQIYGSCVQAFGFALTEEFRLQDGRVQTKKLGQCGIPNFRNYPEVTPILVEIPDPHGPLGAKGVAETASIPTAAAIITAIADATGAWVKKLPARPERVKAAIAAAGGPRPRSRALVGD